MSEELIKKSDAIDAIEVVDWYHQNKNKDMVSGANSDEHQAWYKADDVYKALEATPTIEPKTKVIAQVTFDEEKLREIVKEAVERFKEEYEIEPERERCEYCKDGDFIGQRIMLGNDGKLHKIRFCPNCGTKLEREQNERGLD